MEKIAKIKAEIEKCQEVDYERKFDLEQKCVALFKLKYPYGNYSGPLMFDVEILPLRVAKLFQRFVVEYPKSSVSFYSGRDYDVPLGNFSVSFSEEENMIKAWNVCNLLIPGTSEELISYLSRAVVEVYCEQNSIETSNIFENDELYDISWMESLPVLEELFKVTK